MESVEEIMALEPKPAALRRHDSRYIVPDVFVYSSERLHGRA